MQSTRRGYYPIPGKPSAEEFAKLGENLSDTERGMALLASVGARNPQFAFTIAQLGQFFCTADYRTQSLVWDLLRTEEAPRNTPYLLTASLAGELIAEEENREMHNSGKGNPERPPLTDVEVIAQFWSLQNTDFLPSNYEKEITETALSIVKIQPKPDTEEESGGMEILTKAFTEGGAKEIDLAQELKGQ